jgi:hypothetical protein
MTCRARNGVGGRGCRELDRRAARRGRPHMGPNVARLGDLSLAPCLTCRAFRRHQAKKGHQLARVIKATDVAGFGNQRSSRQKPDAAQCLKRRDHRRHCPGRYDLQQHRVQSVDPFSCSAHRIQHFLVSQPLCWMGKILRTQPAQMPASPSCITFKCTTVSQQKGSDVLALAAVVLGCRCSGSHQVPDRFVRFVRHPDRGQFAGTMQAGQRLCVAPVRLHPQARPSRNHRRRHHHAVVPQHGDLSIQAVPRRPPS